MSDPGLLQKHAHNQAEKCREGQKCLLRKYSSQDVLRDHPRPRLRIPLSTWRSAKGSTENYQYPHRNPAGFPVSADKRYNLHTTGLFPGEKYKGLVYNKEYGDTLLKENQGFS